MGCEISVHASRASRVRRLMFPRTDIPASAEPNRAVDPPTADRARHCALVERMAARDQNAIAELYDETAGKAFGVVLRVVRNAQLAEEVVADAYHQAWRDAQQFDSARGAPLTWLLVICRSRALDALRARDEAITHDDPDTLRDPDEQGSFPDPVDLLTAVESRHALHGALAVLSP